MLNPKFFLDLAMLLIFGALAVNLIMHPQAGKTLAESGGNFLTSQEKIFAGYGYS